MMKRTIREKVIASGIACALSGAQALGAVLYTQDFENLNPGGLAGQDGYTAMAQAQVADGGLAYANGDVVVAGGARSLTFTSLTPANNWVFSRTFPAQSDTVYFSLAMTWTEQAGDDMLLFALSNDADSSPVALGNSAGVHINLTGTQTAGLINGRIRGNTTSETTATSSGKAARREHHITAVHRGVCRQRLLHELQQAPAVGQPDVLPGGRVRCHHHARHRD